MGLGAIFYWIVMGRTKFPDIPRFLNLVFLLKQKGYKSEGSFRCIQCKTTKLSVFKTMFSFSMNGNHFRILETNVSNSTAAQSSSLGIEVDWLILINLLFADTN